MDSVYQHVLAWREALEDAGIRLSVWRIHRRIGMSGGLFVDALLRETGMELSVEQMYRLRDLHAQAYLRQLPQVRPLPGAVDLLETLTSLGIPWAIATSGSRATATPTLDLLQLAPSTPIVTRDEVAFAKPNPDLFLAAAGRIEMAIEQAIVVGDSIWDMLAAQLARAFGVGLLSGGYGREELERTGAYRVYDDPAELLEHLDELGIRRAR